MYKKQIYPIVITILIIFGFAFADDNDFPLRESQNAPGCLETQTGKLVFYHVPSVTTKFPPYYSIGSLNNSNVSSATNLLSTTNLLEDDQRPSRPSLTDDYNTKVNNQSDELLNDISFQYSSYSPLDQHILNYYKPLTISADFFKTNEDSNASVLDDNLSLPIPYPSIPSRISFGFKSKIIDPNLFSNPLIHPRLILEVVAPNLTQNEIYQEFESPELIEYIYPTFGTTENNQSNQQQNLKEKIFYLMYGTTQVVPWDFSAPGQGYVFGWNLYVLRDYAESPLSLGIFQCVSIPEEFHKMPVPSEIGISVYRNGQEGNTIRGGP